MPITPTSIHIKGGGFTEERFPNGVSLNLLQERLNLVYGKNGSGKSTIGNAVAQYCGLGPDGGIEVRFTPELDSQSFQNVFVFNEQYVRDNLLIKKKGPETIAMLGRANVSLEQEIEAIDRSIEDLQKQLEPLNERLKLLGGSGSESVQMRFKQVTAAIKNFGWTKREYQIRQATSNIPKQPSVVESVVCSIEESPEKAKKAGLTDSVADLQLLFDKKLTMLQNAGGAGGAVIWSRPSFRIPFDIAKLQAMLAQVVLKPELSDREKQIFQLFDDNERIRYFRQTRSDILGRHASACPLCHQSIPEGQFTNLEQTISRLLDDESEKFSRGLNEILQTITEFVPSKPLFPEGLYAKELKELENATFKWNRFLNDVRGALTAKAANIFEASAYRIDNEQVQTLTDNLNSALDAVGECVQQYNHDIAKKAGLKAELTLVNSYLSWLQTKDGIEAYNKAVSEHSEVNEKVRNISGQITDLTNSKKSKSTKTDDIPARDYMNRQLENIFYSDKRLKLLGTDNGEYILHSRGHAVSPDRVSTGERNIMALIYFFASLFKGKSDARRYDDPMLVVIDDPVSSFDYGNRLGITAFMAMEIENVLNGNAGSKVLVLSHDINTINDLSSLVPKFNGNCKGQSGKWTYYSELRDGYLKEFGYNGHNEYWKLLRDVFYYAVDNAVTESDDNGIGNKMRVVLETYSNFMFQCGFKEMLSRHDVIDMIPPGQREKYRSFMGRFIFDALSHAENQVNRLTTYQSRFTPGEKRANAKCVLKFICYCSERHLASYLSPKQFETVLDWIDSECGTCCG